MNGSQSRRVFLAAVVACMLTFAGVMAALGIKNAMLVDYATRSGSWQAAQIEVNTSAIADQQLTAVANDIASSSSDLAQVTADIAEAKNK
jgi:hypothetical protein